MLAIAMSVAMPLAASAATVNYPTEIHSFSKTDSIDYSQYGEPPVWVDCPTTPTEAKDLVQKAWIEVKMMLTACGTDVLGYPGKVDVTTPEHPRWDEICWEGDSASRAYVDAPAIEYSQIQRSADAYARSTSSGVHETRTGMSKGYNGSTVKGSIKTETFKVGIEIFPVLFQDHKLFMKSEVFSKEGPWAGSALEAVEFLILHEMGHFESYIRQHIRVMPSRPSPLDEDEDTEDAFASSVFRCSHD